MRDQAIATSVVLLVKTALAPVLERLAAAEARLAVLGDLRDRVVTVETKAAIPLSPPLEAVTVDLTPVLERLAAAEARVSVLGDLRDRVVTVETKAAVPPRDMSELVEGLRDRLGTLEARAANPSTADMALMEIRDKFASLDITKELGAVRERLVNVETQAATPVDLGDVRERLFAIETRADTAVVDLRSKLAAVEQKTDKDAVRLEGHTAFLQRDVAAISERVAVVEVRAQVPGPAGQDGLNGKDGADGLGFDDLQTTQEDHRSFTIKAVRGDRVKDIGTATFPGIPIQRGVYIEGKSYDSGDLVTWAGSQWFCNEPTTTKPGDGLKAWTLIVKRGRDGKDGKDGGPGPEGKPGKDWQQVYDDLRAR